eukprot:14724324-Ditylum_brightwellii.AAC.1
MECCLKKTDQSGKKEASRIADDLNITKINDLNTLYYAVAYTVSPPKNSDNNLSDKSDPPVSYEDKLNRNIEYARKLVVELTALRRKDTPLIQNTVFSK